MPIAHREEHALHILISLLESFPAPPSFIPECPRPSPRHRCTQPSAHRPCLRSSASLKSFFSLPSDASHPEDTGFLLQIPTEKTRAAHQFKIYILKPHTRTRRQDVRLTHTCISFPLSPRLIMPLVFALTPCTRARAALPTTHKSRSRRTQGAWAWA